eukprot:CAMPEP_0202917334 /NCGR_PEP_ID=MMETSP1392-20130828/70767_1 /ASSEMBLY_ACC=CAM_ASM_000868 /TAXON_ID=225041 /ORGANISM="Chlamydomonas chlamydogama, Strain SAG 11-48b" /LENGTH=136 /DNA_ID=CAMNT_0049610059 /DNA_START=430 /DNA_END=841 /DNA_ORIENTATION=-
MSCCAAHRSADCANSSWAALPAPASSPRPSAPHPPLMPRCSWLQHEHICECRRVPESVPAAASEQLLGLHSLRQAAAAATTHAVRACSDASGEHAYPAWPTACSGSIPLRPQHPGHAGGLALPFQATAPEHARDMQ